MLGEQEEMERKQQGILAITISDDNKKNYFTRKKKGNSLSQEFDKSMRSKSFIQRQMVERQHIGPNA